MNCILTMALLLAGQAPADVDAPASAAASVEDANSAAADNAPKPAANDSPDSAAAAAATPDDDEVSEAEESKFSATLDEIMHTGALGLLLDGGFFMWPILLMGIVAFGVIIERYRSLKMLATDDAALRSDVQRLLSEDRVEEALQLCDREQGPVPAILSSGLRKFLVLRRLNYDPGKIEEQVVKGMDDYSIHVVAALERRLPILATVSSAAPMLGFLGTVQGMIVAFSDIVEKMGETNIVESAADGISVALLTTCLGLIVGIPAFVAFNYFTSVINRFVLDVEESAAELIETVTLQMALEKLDGAAAGQESSPAEVSESYR